jgi:hypothetical protein
MSIFIFIVCAEAYNPDEEEDDAESRVCNLMSELMLLYDRRKIIIVKMLLSYRSTGDIVKLCCVFLFLVLSLIPHFFFNFCRIIFI